MRNAQGVTDNLDQTRKSLEEKPDASYVELEAEYRYREDGTIRYAGTIRYRFCLGENIFNDYNVFRNTHYAVTLQLDRWCGASEGGYVMDGQLGSVKNGTSWRVDMELEEN